MFSFAIVTYRNNRIAEVQGQPTERANAVKKFSVLVLWPERITNSTRTQKSLSERGGIGKLSKKQSGARERERDDVSGTRYVGRCRGTRSRV